MDWFTKVNNVPLKCKISINDNILMIGSCFANEIGSILLQNGFNCVVNPYGTMYNPISIINSLASITQNTCFNERDVINISKHSTTNSSSPEFFSDGSKFCSFSHHSSLSKGSVGDFLLNVNKVTSECHNHFNDCKFVILTLGTAWVYRHIASDSIVSNCHKINPKEFTRERLSVNEVVDVFSNFIKLFPGKEFIFTVSPIRHFKESAHGNQLSKSTLLLAVEQLCSMFENVGYFPSYEIMLDELRDYRFYAEDMVHPSKQAVEYIFSRFKESCISENSYQAMATNLKVSKRAGHI